MDLCLSVLRMLVVGPGRNEAGWGSPSWREYMISRMRWSWLIGRGSQLPKHRFGAVATIMAR